MYTIFIYMYILVSTLGLFFKGKPIVRTTHAIKRAREKGIAYPDQVYNTIKTGKIKKFGKNMLKFLSKSSIICVGEDLGHTIIIKTITRGN